VQRLRRLVGRRSAREAEHSFVVEGAKVLGEALAAGVPVESVYIDRTLLSPIDPAQAVLDQAYSAGSRVYELEPGVLGKIASTVTPQPVLAVVSDVDVPLAWFAAHHADLVVVCVDVRDPGNAGTVLRSAEAAGASGVVYCDGSVDLFNPKTVRASAGAVFHVPVVVGGDAAEVLDQLGQWGLCRLGAFAAGGQDYTAADLTAPVALVLGNEAQGLPDHLDRMLDRRIMIPMAGQAESLNVGIAAAVLCFEAARQRRVAASGQSTGRAG
jgi:RNA methyltransferase, TrmH family